MTDKHERDRDQDRIQKAEERARTQINKFFCQELHILQIFQQNPRFLLLKRT